VEGAVDRGNLLPGMRIIQVNEYMPSKSSPSAPHSKITPITSFEARGQQEVLQGQSDQDNIPPESSPSSPSSPSPEDSQLTSEAGPENTSSSEEPQRQPNRIIPQNRVPSTPDVIYSKDRRRQERSSQKVITHIKTYEWMLHGYWNGMVCLPRLRA
jgi:hypothetical protein